MAEVEGEVGAKTCSLKLAGFCALFRPVWNLAIILFSMEEFLSCTRVIHK